MSRTTSPGCVFVLRLTGILAAICAPAWTASADAVRAQASVAWTQTSLVELLRGGRLLIQQTLRAIEIAPRDLELTLERGPLCTRGLDLGSRGIALRQDHVPLTDDFVDARGGGFVLCGCLVAL